MAHEDDGEWPSARWDKDGIKTGGNYKVGLNYPFVPLIDGKLTIDIEGGAGFACRYRA